MKIRKSILALIVAAASVNAVAQTSDAVLRDKMTNAVMKVYDDHLTENPNDYNTLFARAHQQYYNGDYTAALADVNQAMLLTPKTDKELRFDEYILRARISDVRKDYASELADLRLAHELQPKSLACTDLIAKANLKAGNLDAAEKAFKTILRAESMNYDAMYGLAQVEMARNHPKEAISQVDKAVSLFKAEPQVYVNRADIYTRQGNIDAAVIDLLQGMTVGDGGLAAQRLFDLSDIDYDAVMRALDDLSNRTNDPGMYRYLRANIAMDHSRYGQALRDLNFIKRNNLYDSHSLYYNIGKCYLELGRYDEALTNASQALTMDPSQPEYYILKALVEYNLGEGGNFDTAMQTLGQCSAMYPQYVPMLTTKAELLWSQGRLNDALGYFNAAVANDPTDGEAQLSRAMLLNKLEKASLALKGYNIVTCLNDEDYGDLKGIAYSELGRDNDAFNWLQNSVAKVTTGGEKYYYAALFMAMRGDNYKALEYLQKAVEKGYGSLYKLQYDKLTPFNLGSLREDPQFQLLIEKARPNFAEVN